ncbi:MAG: DUF881 domain-containing protein [Mycobacteriales bacterium]
MGEPGRAASPRGWSVLVPLMALVAGLLFATSAATAAGTDLRSDRRVQLTELIRDQEHRVSLDTGRTVALRAQVQSATAALAAGDGRVAGARAAADDLAMPVGLVAVSGPVTTVTLDDAPASAATGAAGRPAPNDLVVHQQDVEAVVNALWAGGAEAMTIMGERVIATSAVRCVGNTLLLHGAVYSPPFVISAIGDPRRLRGALDTSPGVVVFRQYVAAYGLGYDVSAGKTKVLPAYRGSLEFSHARAAQ